MMSGSCSYYCELYVCGMEIFLSIIIVVLALLFYFTVEYRSKVYEELLERSNERIHSQMNLNSELFKKLSGLHDDLIEICESKDALYNSVNSELKACKLDNKKLRESRKSDKARLIEFDKENRNLRVRINQLHKEKFENR